MCLNFYLNLKIFKMDNKNQSQRLKGNFMNNKLKQFLSETNNKKEIIRSFKKRYINQ